MAPHIRSNIHICACSHSGNSCRTRGVHVKNNRVIVSFIRPRNVIGSVHLNIPLDIGVSGNITTVTVTHLTNIDSRRLHTNVSDFEKIRQHFSFGLGDSLGICLDSCTRRPTRVHRDTLSVHRLCIKHGIATVFRPRLCSHARSFCQRFTRDLSLFSRIVLASVCPTHRTPVPNIADTLVCSGLTPRIRGRVVNGSSMLTTIRTQGDRLRVLIALNTNSVRGCTSSVIGVLGG